MRSMRCLPFSAPLYRELQMRGLDAAAIWNERSRYAKTERWPRSAEALEDDLRWLITVGVLRREVDGQGLTARVRLTPMGNQLLKRWPQGWPPAGPWQRLRHGIRRHWPRL